MSFASQFNLELIESYQRQWRHDPLSVPEPWRAFFEGFELGRGESDARRTDAQVGVLRLVFAHRDLGHRSAFLNPLDWPPEIDIELTPGRYGLTDADMDDVFGTTYIGMPKARLRELLSALRETYC